MTEMEFVRREELEPGMVLVTIDRQDRRNALGPPVLSELHRTFDDLGADPAVRVVMITGAGGAFSSGADVKGGGPPGEDGGSVAGNLLGRVSGQVSRMFLSQEHMAGLFEKIHRLRQPVIAAVNGPAYGGGFGIALACDIRIGSASARFCTQFIKLGLGGCDIGVSYTLPRIIGAGPAFDLILTARAVDAQEALQLGLVSRLSDSVVDDAQAIAETLCGYGKFGVESTKQVMWANLDAGSLESALHLENRSQLLASTSGEMTEAASAVLPRRQR